MWSWDKPGIKYVIGNKNIFLENQYTKRLDNFIFLNIDIIYLDQLILTQPIHMRK